MGISQKSMVSGWALLIPFLVVSDLGCWAEATAEEGIDDNQTEREEVQHQHPWLGSLLGLTRRDLRADKEDMFWATRGKRNAEDSDFWAIRGKKQYIKPNGFFQAIATPTPGKRSMDFWRTGKRSLKPNGLFGSIKRASLKPNSLFTSFKRTGLNSTFVEYEFCGKVKETSASLLFPTIDKPALFDYSETFKFTKSGDHYEHLYSALLPHQQAPTTLKFTLVDDPGDEEDQDCQELGTAVIDIKQFIEGDNLEEASIPVTDTTSDSAICNLIVDIKLRETIAEIMADMN